MAVVAAVLGVLAGIAWLSALVHGLLLLPHRRDDLSIARLMLQGYRFYRKDTWKPSGHALHARMMGSAIAFFSCALLGAIAGALSA